MRLYLWLLVMVVRSVYCTLDLGSFGITWNVPLPTESDVSSTRVTVTSAATVTSTTVGVASTRMTVTSTPAATTLDKVTHTTLATSTTSVTSRLPSSTPMTLPVEIPTVGLVTVTTSFSSDPKIDLDLAPEIDLSFATKNVSVLTFERNMTYDLDPTNYSSVVSSVDLPPSNVTFDEIEDEIDQLEEEARSLNITQDNDSNTKPERLNIWTKSAEFLAAPDGLAFLLVLVASGQEIFSLFKGTVLQLCLIRKFVLQSVFCSEFLL